MAELEAGPALDGLVVEKVLGWERLPSVTGCYDRWRKPNGRLGVTRSDTSMVLVFRPSRDIAAAWQVIERFPEHCISLVRMMDGPWVCMLIPKRSDVSLRYAKAAADTAPLAICRAALAALDADA